MKSSTDPIPKVQEMNFELLHENIIQKLEVELPNYLSYHNANHTKYVIQKATELGEFEGLSDKTMVLIKTAALMHDTGFLIHNLEHESLSCNISKELLPKYGYSIDNIIKICDMIMATKIPQSPKSIEEQVLCDADLYYFGTERYFIFADKLYSEYKFQNIVNSKAEWKTTQIDFLNSHHYFTKTAIGLLTDIKALNLKKIKAS